VSRVVERGDLLIVDGNSGTVIVRPDDPTLKSYRLARRKWQEHERVLGDLVCEPAETMDGRTVRLDANMEVPEELDSIRAHNPDGIGLYRSEFLFIGPHEYPSEDRQYETIAGIVKAMEGRTVVVRTLDLGGDKVIPGYKDAAEDNPILGWRAVRFCLAKPTIFKAHLRAILRASAHGPIKIMFPMISGLIELERVIAVLAEVKDELRRRNVPFDQDIPIGIMIEVPSAALTADLLAPKVDFFSIGTNDLIQYTIAVDRGNERIAYLYQPFHPAVLRLIRMVIDAGHQHGIPVGMCGEMASDPHAAAVLLGLGLDSFSMSAISIPEVKRIIRSITVEEARGVADRVMKMSSCREINNFVRQWMGERFELLTG
jgi:phosphotransferase system enzyme I (PtsI)